MTGYCASEQRMNPRVLPPVLDILDDSQAKEVGLYSGPIFDFMTTSSQR